MKSNLRNKKKTPLLIKTGAFFLADIFYLSLSAASKQTKIAIKAAFYSVREKTIIAESISTVMTKAIAAFNTG